MLAWDVAERVIHQLKTCNLPAADFLELRREFWLACVKYARIRADWQLNPEERPAGVARSIAHNRVIDACNALSRCMGQHGADNKWRDTLGQDRKVIGDFACYVHAYFGLRAR